MNILSKPAALALAIPLGMTLGAGLAYGEELIREALTTWPLRTLLLAALG